MNFRLAVQTDTKNDDDAYGSKLSRHKTRNQHDLWPLESSTNFSFAEVE